MKKTACLLLSCVILLLSLVSCSKAEKAYPLVIDGQNVPPGVFAYYADRVISQPKKYGVKKSDKSAALSKAAELCTETYACEKLMKSGGIVTATQYKSTAADNTEKMWSLFSSHYKKLGITKPDITRVMVFEQQKKQLVAFYYGKGGKNGVSDDELKQKFVDMYVGFKAFEGEFTKTNVKGESVAMTASEKAKLTDEFRSMADKINDGASIDDVYASYCSKQGLVATNEIDVTITKKSDPMYADDFFDKVKTISHGKAAPVISGSSIYVVERCTIATDDGDAFEKYKDDVLFEMKEGAVNKKITAACKKLDIKKDSETINEIFDFVYEMKSEK